MSISDAINNAKQKINNVYNVLESKGATMPETKDLYNMVGTVEELSQLSSLNSWSYSGSNGTLNLEKYTADGYPVVLNVPYMEGLYINNWVDSSSSGTTDANRLTPFYNNQHILEVNLNNTPFVNNSMNYAFSGCENLTRVYNVSNKVTSMTSTFRDCDSFREVQIPNSVVDMYDTFLNCSQFGYKFPAYFQIPDSVVNMGDTFKNCQGFNIPVNIGNSVVNMHGAFRLCNKFNQSVQIPDSVENLRHTFDTCSSLDSSIQIGNSVKYMSLTFNGCTNLNQPIQIPNSVTNLSRTFGECTSLNQNITIYSNQVTDATNCFVNTSLPKNVYIPFQYSNGVNTVTFSSFKTAGYIYANGVSNNQHGVTVYDLNQL